MENSLLGLQPWSLKPSHKTRLSQEFFQAGNLRGFQPETFVLLIFSSLIPSSFLPYVLCTWAWFYVQNFSCTLFSFGANYFLLLRVQALTSSDVQCREVLFVNDTSTWLALLCYKLWAEVCQRLSLWKVWWNNHWSERKGCWKMYCANLLLKQSQRLRKLSGTYCHC